MNTHPPITLVNSSDGGEEDFGEGQEAPTRRSVVRWKASWATTLVGATAEEVIREVHERSDGMSPADLADLAAVLAHAEGATDSTFILHTIREVMALHPTPHDPDAFLELARVIESVGSRALDGTGPSDAPDPDSSDPFVLNEARAPPCVVNERALAVDAIVAELAIASRRMISLAQRLVGLRSPALRRRLDRAVEAFWQACTENDVGDGRRRELVAYVRQL